MVFQGNDIQMGWVFHAYVILLKGMIIRRAIFKTFSDNNLCIYIYIGNDLLEISNVIWQFFNVDHD